MLQEPCSSTFTIYRFGPEDSIGFQLLHHSNARCVPVIEVYNTELYLIQGEGDKFDKENLREFTVTAFFKFIEEHKEALRRLA